MYRYAVAPPTASASAVVVAVTAGAVEAEELGVAAALDSVVAWVVAKARVVAVMAAAAMAMAVTAAGAKASGAGATAEGLGVAAAAVVKAAASAEGLVMAVGERVAVMAVAAGAVKAVVPARAAGKCPARRNVASAYGRFSRMVGFIRLSATLRSWLCRQRYGEHGKLQCRYILYHHGS